MQSRGSNTRFLRAEAVLLAALLLAWAGLSRGLGASDWSGLLLAMTPLALAAMAQSIPVLAGGQGLAAGATALLVDVVLGGAPIASPGAALAWIVIGLLIGGAIGLGNGILIGVLRLPSTAVTFATGIAVGACAYGLARDGTGEAPAALSALLFGPQIFGLPAVPVVMMAMAAAGGLLFQRTRSARALQRIGAGAPLAERRLPAARLRCIAYGLAGLGYGATGIVLAAQVGAMDSMLGLPVLIQVFAAVTLAGGCPGLRAGSIPGALLGAGIVAATSNLLIPLGLPDIVSPALDAAWLMLGLAACRLASDRPPHIALAVTPVAPATRCAALGIVLLLLLAILRPEASGVATIGAGLALLAVGQGAVMRAGGFDLAMPAMIGASGMATVALSQGSLPRFGLAVAVIAVVAAMSGFSHAMLARRLGRAGILATLAGAGLLQAIATALMVMLPTGFAPLRLTALAAESWLGLPLPVWILLPAALLLAMLLDRRGGPTAAYLASALTAAAFGILLACLGGAFRLGWVDVYLVPVVAGVVLGGIDFNGARGSLVGAVGGVLILQVADTLLVAFGLSYEARVAAMAAIILLRAAARRGVYDAIRRRSTVARA